MTRGEQRQFLFDWKIKSLRAALARLEYLTDTMDKLIHCETILDKHEALDEARKLLGDK